MCDEDMILTEAIWSVIIWKGVKLLIATQWLCIFNDKDLWDHQHLNPDESSHQLHHMRGVASLDSPIFSNDWRLISRTKFKNLLGKHTVHDWFPGLIRRFKIFANLKKVDFLGEKNKNENNFQNLERCCWHTTLHSWFLICGRNETGRKVLTGRATVTSELIIGKSKQQCMHEWRKVLLKGFWSQCVTARFLPQFSASLEI